MESFINEVLSPLSIFGGIALVILAANKAKIARIAAERGWQQPAAPLTRQDDAVLAELKALQEKMGEMQSTSHQFDISFDAALNRLEGRVDRLETRAAAATVQPAGTAAEPPQSLRNGTP